MPRKYMRLPIPYFLEEMKHQKAAAFQIAITIRVALRSSDTINHHTTREAFRTTTVELIIYRISTKPILLHISDLLQSGQKSPERFKKIFHL